MSRAIKGRAFRLLGPRLMADARLPETSAVKDADAATVAMTIKAEATPMGVVEVERTASLLPTSARC